MSTDFPVLSDETNKTEERVETHSDSTIPPIDISITNENPVSFEEFSSRNENSTFHPVSQQYQVSTDNPVKSDLNEKYISRDDFVRIESSTNLQVSSDYPESTTDPTLPDNPVATDKQDSNEILVKIELSPGQWKSASDQETVDHLIEVQKKNVKELEGKINNSFF